MVEAGHLPVHHLSSEPNYSPMTASWDHGAVSLRNTNRWYPMTQDARGAQLE
jgi:hypothetical protein